MKTRKPRIQSPQKLAESMMLLNLPDDKTVEMFQNAIIEYTLWHHSKKLKLA